MVTVEQITQLPMFHRETITTDHLDHMGHMNIRHYMAIFDDAGWKFFHTLGMTEDYYRQNNAGGFALKHFINYLAEVRVGETVAVHIRLLGRSEKRKHMMYFLVNDTTKKLAATIEILGAHADMAVRRMSPYPPHICEKMDALLAEHNTLDWEAPVSGVIQP